MEVEPRGWKKGQEFLEKKKRINLDVIPGVPPRQRMDMRA